VKKKKQAGQGDEVDGGGRRPAVLLRAEGYTGHNALIKLLNPD
jgi:hypothetical protein